MTQLIDARTSMGMSRTDSNADFIPPEIPTLLAQVGLNVPSTTPGIIRVQFNGIVGVQLPDSPAPMQATLSLVRGTESTDTVVYESYVSFDTASNNQLVPLSASDYNVPAPNDGMLVYTLFVTTSTDSPFLLSGPVNLNSSVYADS